MTDKHPDAGVEAAIKVVERKLLQVELAKDAALNISAPGMLSAEVCELVESELKQLIKQLRALPAQQPEPLPSIEGARGGQKVEA